ncbi:breast cancer type 1 susceptibility protein homolog isoform X2 [Leptopilina heterotoma]|nr:breast cancer type 1 susceptibility protein homolog isoform X2 [Leptopilina heterotoma]
MIKRSAHCPMCNGTLTRRTLVQNNQLNDIIEHFHKIENAVKADINFKVDDHNEATLDSETANNILKQTSEIENPKSENKRMIEKSSPEEVNVLTEKVDNVMNQDFSFVKNLQSQSLSLPEDSVRPSFQVQQFKSTISTKSVLERTRKSSETNNLVPFKKLGRMFKKQRQIPFYYFGKLNKSKNEERRNDDSFTTTVPCSKDSKVANSFITNLSDSGISKTRGNLSLEISKVNDSFQNSPPSEIRTLVLISPQNDSQLKDLSPDTSKMNESIPSSQTVELRTLDLVPPQNDSQLRHLSIDTPQETREIPLSNNEVNNTQKETDVQQSEKYRHILDDLDINTELFKELESFPQFRESDKPVENEVVEESNKFDQNTDSSSIVPCSLNRVLEKPPVHAVNSFHSHSHSPEPEDLASHFFADVIEKSKIIRRQSSLNLVNTNKETSPKIQSGVITGDCEKSIARNEQEILANKLNSSTTEPSQLFSFIDKFKENRKAANEIEQVQSHNKDVSISEKEDLVNMSNISMDISEEQIMLDKFEKQLFGVKTCQEDSLTIPDNLKKSNEDSRKSSFSSHNFETNALEEKKPSKKTGVKRKSYPLYHSTPKVMKTNTSRTSKTCLDLEPLNTSPTFENHDETCRELIAEKGFEEKRKLSFVCSGLSGSQIQEVKNLCELVDADFIGRFNSTATHVIVKVVGQRNTAEKTLKYLQGIAYGKWIVSIDWVSDSLQRKELLNEDKYEVVDNLTLEEGPKKSRLRTRNIFEGFICLCQGPFNDVSVADYSDLLIHMGATILQKMEDFINYNNDNNKKIIIMQCDHWDDDVIRDWFKKTKAVPVEQEWLVECISQYKVISLFDYIQGISPEEASTVGLPEDLLKEEFEYDSED